MPLFPKSLLLTPYSAVGSWQLAVGAGAELLDTLFVSLFALSAEQIGILKRGNNQRSRARGSGGARQKLHLWSKNVRMLYPEVGAPTRAAVLQPWDTTQYVGTTCYVPKYRLSAELNLEKHTLMLMLQFKPAIGRHLIICNNKH